MFSSAVADLPNIIPTILVSLEYQDIRCIYFVSDCITIGRTDCSSVNYLLGVEKGRQQKGAGIWWRLIACDEMFAPSSQPSSVLIVSLNVLTCSLSRTSATHIPPSKHSGGHWGRKFNRKKLINIRGRIWALSQILYFCLDTSVQYMYCVVH